MKSRAQYTCVPVAMASSSSCGLPRPADLRDLGDKPNQPSSFTFPKRKFGETKPVYRSFQPGWFQKWPWLHYDQGEDRAFCYYCVQALKQGSIRMSSSLTTKAEDAFVTRGYTNWKDASGEKRGGFPTHERSQVSSSNDY